MKKFIFSLLISLLAVSPLFADEFQSLDQLQSQIEAYLLNELTAAHEGKIGVRADRIDSRLKLKPCKEEELEVFNPYKTPLIHTSTLGIRCTASDNRWTVYVPVTISLKKMVVVAKHPIPRGTHINSDDLYTLELDVEKLKQGYFSDPKEVVGLLSKHNIMDGSPFTPQNVELPKLVKRGDMVTIIASKPGLTVSMKGVAIKEGILGETIQIKNLNSKKIIDATVSGDKEVRVTL